MLCLSTVSGPPAGELSMHKARARNQCNLGNILGITGTDTAKAYIMELMNLYSVPTLLLTDAAELVIGRPSASQLELR